MALTLTESHERPPSKGNHVQSHWLIGTNLALGIQGVLPEKQRAAAAISKPRWGNHPF
jgi:hypothetical protein